MSRNVGWSPNRRQVIGGGLAASLLTATAPFSLARAATDTARIYGVSTMALTDWTPFTELTGLGMEYTPVNADPGAYIREIVANGIGDNYDIFIFQGNTPSVLGPSGHYAPIDTEDPAISIWKGIPDTYKLTADCTANGVVYGVPIVNNADSFGFWPSELDIADPLAPVSWGLVFESDKTRGRVALDKTATYSMSVMAQWVKQSGQGTIADPTDLTPPEAKVVADYGIARKRAGQFRTFFSTFDEQVDLLSRKEVLALNCWEPCILEVNKTLGSESVYYAYSDYYYQWGDSAYVSPAAMAAGRWPTIAKALSFFMGEGGAYRALQARDKGYGGPNMPLALDYARKAGWSEAEIANVAKVGAKVDAKFSVPDFWGKSNPTNADAMEEEWQRFLSA